MLRRVRGPIPENQIDQAIARDSELTWSNISNKPVTYPPSTHGHSSDEGAPEPWLENLLNSVISSKVLVQHLNLNQGLAVNTWSRIWSPTNLNQYIVYLAKIRLECGSVPPYNGCAVFQIATTMCANTNTIYSSQMMLHNGNSINVELRASGGGYSSPAIDLRFPSQAIPINSHLINEFLELF